MSMNFCRFYNRVRKNMGKLTGMDYTPTNHINIAVGLLILIFLIPVFYLEKVFTFIWKILNSIYDAMPSYMKWSNAPKIDGSMLFFGLFMLAMSFVIGVAVYTYTIDWIGGIVSTMMLYLLVSIGLVFTIYSYNPREGGRVGDILLKNPYMFIERVTTSHCDLPRNPQNSQVQTNQENIQVSNSTGDNN